MTTFKEMIEAVDENNRINDASWASWECVYHLQSIYGAVEGEYKEVYIHFLAALIRNNGENIQTYLDACNALEYGTVFSPLRKYENENI